MQDTSQTTQKIIPQQQAVSRIVEPPAVSGNREHGPINTARTEFSEQIKPRAEAPIPSLEVVIPSELKNVIEKGPDAKEPEIGKEMRTMGVKLVKESISVSPASVNLPMTYSQAVQKERKSSFRDGIHWLAALIMYEWRKSGIA